MLHTHRLPIIFTIVCICLSACAAPTGIPFPSPTITATQLPTVSPTETVTSTPTPEPTANPEDAYYQSLTAEQQALFDQTKDMTEDGFTRQFLVEQGLTSYLAYYDTDGEVAFVWNFEQGKPNPALKIENNLLINETSGSHIIWNPELNRVEAQKTLADYFRYARARVIAGANHVELGNTLESALANPLTQEYLLENHNLTLHATTSNFGVGYNVPNQSFNIYGQTAFVINFMGEPSANMYKYGTAEKYYGIGYRQDVSGALIAEFYRLGEEELMPFKEHRAKILSQRLGRILSLMFARAEKQQARIIDDPVTYQAIFNPSTLAETDPLIVFSKNR